MAKKPNPPVAATIDAMADLFGAPTIAAPAAKKSKAKVLDQVEFEGLEQLAAFKVLHKVLEKEMEVLEAGAKEIAMDQFAKRTHEDGAKPENFDAVSNRAAVACQLAKKAVTSPLSAEIADELKELGIPVLHSVKVEARLVLNPELDQTVLARLAELVQKDPLLNKHVIVMKQAEVAIDTVAENTIDKLAEKDEETIRRLLPKVANLAFTKWRLADANGNLADIEEGGKGEKMVSSTAKATAIRILQDDGVLPKPEVVSSMKGKKVS